MTRRIGRRIEAATQKQLGAGRAPGFEAWTHIDLPPQQPIALVDMEVHDAGAPQHIKTTSNALRHGIQNSDLATAPDMRRGEDMVARACEAEALLQQNAEATSTRIADTAAGTSQGDEAGVEIGSESEVELPDDFDSSTETEDADAENQALPARIAKETEDARGAVARLLAERSQGAEEPNSYKPLSMDERLWHAAMWAERDTYTIFKLPIRSNWERPRPTRRELGLHCPWTAQLREIMEKAGPWKANEEHARGNGGPPR